MNERRSTCPDCNGAMQPIRFIDATEPGLAEAGVMHKELHYAAPDAEPSFFMQTVPTLGIVRGFICGKCGRILLHGEPQA